MNISLKENNIEIQLKQNHENLYWIKVFNFEKSNPVDLNNILTKFNTLVKKDNIEILTSDLDSKKETNSFLNKSIMRIYKQKGFYTKDLKKLSNLKNDSFHYTPLSQYSDSVILDLFSKVTKGDIDIESDTNKEFKDIIEYANDINYKNNWKFILKDSKKIGMILPHVFQDNTKEGSLLYVGLIEKHRRKGYAKEIHARGLQFLKENNAEKYIGSTLLDNIAMKKTFENNNCIIDCIQLYYKA